MSQKSRTRKVMQNHSSFSNGLQDAVMTKLQIPGTKSQVVCCVALRITSRGTTRLGITTLRTPRQITNRHTKV